MVVTRESGQEAVLSAYMHWCFILVEYCTGFGKGKAALDAVLKRSKEHTAGRSKGLIIVHSISAKKITWPQEIQKWVPQLVNHSDIKIACYPSLRNIKGEHYDWIIADECHYITLGNVSFFRNNSFSSLILMTGTLPDDPNKISILKQLCNCRKLTITLDEAISNNILNDYRVIVWNIKLSAHEWTEYLQLCEQVDYAVRKNRPLLERNARSDRMQFIYSLESKYQAACYIRDQLRAKDRRMIIFCCSKYIAERISPYHLFQGTGDKDFKDFTARIINELSSIKMIQEGANIDDLQAAVIQQLNSKSLNFMQMLGRLMRLAIDEVATVHIICAKDTYDAHWVHKALEKADIKKITYKDLPRERFTHYL